MVMAATWHGSDCYFILFDSTDILGSQVQGDMENHTPLMFELMGSSLLGSQDTMDPDTIYSIHCMCRSLLIDFHILNTYRTKATYLFWIEQNACQMSADLLKWIPPQWYPSSSYHQSTRLLSLLAFLAITSHSYTVAAWGITLRRIRGTSLTEIKAKSGRRLVTMRHGTSKS